MVKTEPIILVECIICFYDKKKRIYSKTHFDCFILEDMRDLFPPALSFLASLIRAIASSCGKHASYIFYCINQCHSLTAGLR